MSYANFISFPKELDSYPLSAFQHRKDELQTRFPEFRHLESIKDDLRLYFPPEAPLHNGIVWIFENSVATFEDCFDNPFVYMYDVRMVDIFSAEKTSIIKRHLDKEVKEGWLDIESMNLELEKYRSTARKRYLQVLYEFICNNIAAGEFSEIYVADQYTDFGGISPQILRVPRPKSKYSANLRDLLNPTKLPDISKFDVGCKLTIYKTM